MINFAVLFYEIDYFFNLFIIRLLYILNKKKDRGFRGWPLKKTFSQRFGGFAGPIYLVYKVM